MPLYTKYKYLHSRTTAARTVDLWFIYIYWTPSFGWFRWFGNGDGWKWKHKSEHLLFSERNGYVKLHRIGDWIFIKIRKRD